LACFRVARVCQRQLGFLVFYKRYDRTQANKQCTTIESGWEVYDKVFCCTLTAERNGERVLKIGQELVEVMNEYNDGVYMCPMHC